MPVTDRFRMDGQVVIVTGAAGGIGRGVVETLASAGASVVVSDRDKESADAVALAIKSAGGRAISVACDVTSERDRSTLVDRALRAFGFITGLVNSEGGGGPKPFDMPMADFDWAYRLNVFAPFRLMQLCAKPIEKAGGGAILNISSMTCDRKSACMSSYASSMAALRQLTCNAAFDLGPMNVRVNTIAPGAVRTAALAAVLNPAIETEMLAHTPLKRLGEPADIGLAALFLCSPASAWISGQVLTVSGGGVQGLDV